MRVGAVFPQTEIGTDAAVIRDFAQAAESLGYDHLLVTDHVLGADISNRECWDGPYRHTDMFHEPFVLLGYIAGITKDIGLTTAVLILGQRQTALVAKQAAEIDVLSGGRLRLGIGAGWNKVEYEALGENFHNRGRRSEEQIELMRTLWTNEVVDYEGLYHKVTHAGINPPPIQQPIPIWVGGDADAVVRRVGQISDGWFPQFQPDEAGQERIEMMRQHSREAGRDPLSIGIEGWISMSNQSNPDSWGRTAEAWAKVGATHIAVSTMNAKLKTPDQHIDAIRSFKEAVSS